MDCESSRVAPFFVETGNDKKQVYGIITGGMVLIGIPNQDICDLQITGKIMEPNNDYRIYHLIRF